MNVRNIVLKLLIIILLKLQPPAHKKTYMDRDIPVFNRPVMQKIFRKNQQKHLQRLRHIKSGNSNRTMPISINNNHTLSNKKAILTEQFKKTEIQKQNMMRIMRRNDPNNNQNNGQLGRVVNKIQSENSRIVQENRGILQRIQQQRPTISNKKLQQDRLKNLSILRFLGKYPNTGARTNYDSSTANSQVGRRSQTKKKYQSYYNRGENLQQFDIDQETYDEEIRNYQEQIDKMKDRNLNSSSGRRKYMSQAVNRNHQKVDSQENQGLAKLQSVDVSNQVPQLYQQYRVKQRQQSKTSQKSHQNLNNNPNQQKPHFPQNPTTQPPTKQIILFHKNLPINKTIASVNIIRQYNLYIIRAVFEQAIKGNRVYQLQIPQNQGNQFFSQNNYDYNKICKMLMIEDGCLVVNTSACLTEENQKFREVLQPKSSQRMLIQKTSDVRIQDSADHHWAKYEEALEEYIQ